MTEPTTPNPEPTPEPTTEPATRDFATTLSAFADEISERVTVLVDKATPIVKAGAARASAT